MIQAKLQDARFTQFSHIFRTDTNNYTLDDIEREYEEWRYIFLNILGFKEEFELNEFIVSGRLSTSLARTSRYSRSNRGWLTVNRNYIEHHSNPDSFHSTLAHETIHTLKDCFNHGPSFKNAGFKVMALYSGLKIGRTSNDPGYMTYLNSKPVKKVEDKYKIVCSDCGQTFYRQRLSKLVKNPNNFRCGKCHGKFKIFELMSDGTEVQRIFI